MLSIFKAAHYKKSRRAYRYSRHIEIRYGNAAWCCYLGAAWRTTKDALTSSDVIGSRSMGQLIQDSSSRQAAGLLMQRL